MSIVLVLEASLACLLAAALGNALDKRKGRLALFSITFFASLLTLFVVQTVYALGYFPLNHLDLNSWWSPENYVGQTFLIIELAIWAYLLSSGLGYAIGDEWIGAIFTFFAFALAMGGLAAGVQTGLAEQAGLMQAESVLNGGILVEMALYLFWFLGLLAIVKFSMTNLGALTLGALTCSLVLIRLGLGWAILPALLVFAVALYAFSQQILPLREDVKAQKMRAYRSLITFMLGTNRPYYLIDDWKKRENRDQDLPEPRVSGEVFNRSSFAGPGIVLNDCNHAAVMSDGFKIRVLPPGLSFTNFDHAHRFEELQAAVDLRPQHRVTTIQAETQEGIITNTLVFMPHRIDVNGGELELGQPYPYDEEKIKKVVGEFGYVNHDWSKEEDLAIEEISQIPWDELVKIAAPPILKDIIINYPCNKLHESKEARTEIAQAFVARLRDEMYELGIEVIGGGISNITTPDEVVEQRIKNWEAKWEREIEIERGELEAQITTQLETVWAEAQLEVLETLVDILSTSGSVTDETMAFQLVDALGAALPRADAKKGTMPWTANFSS
jgi:hypothetical protein